METIHIVIESIVNDSRCHEYGLGDQGRWLGSGIRVVAMSGMSRLGTEGLGS